MSCQQNQQQCQPPPKCQTPKILPQAPCSAPISSCSGSSHGGGCSSGSGMGCSSGSEGGCSLFSHHHRRSHRCRRQSSDHCDSGSGHSQQSGDSCGSSGGCC
ncbi:late cornified envelope protein 3D-like [Gracilinanus agilis]|uniref:late cornified envelope protein 3D-like n=1 Tax=Gracilinanus agilis TaxID=191870 RepID=UPI001CFE006A|nr:late cornified envelope protein 3D-like [Gracilinanus agilis]